MKTKLITKLLLNMVALVAALNLVGCLQMALRGDIRKQYEALPTFENTENSWPALGESRGRVVVYWRSGDVAAGVAKDVALGTAGSEYHALSLAVEGNQAAKGSVGTGTFVFTDLNAGKQTFAFRRRKVPPLVGFGAKPYYVDTCSVSVDVRPKEISFLEITDEKSVKIIASDEARNALKSLRHAYDRALPFQDQPKDGKRFFVAE